MTARLDVTPKTTEQNRIVCTSKSEAEVTNNKKLRSTYCTIDATKLTTDRHEASRDLFATAELLVYSNIKDVLFGQKAVAHETVMLASELKSHLVDKLKNSAADGKT